MIGIVGLNGILVNLGNADNLKLELGIVLGDTLKCERLRAVSGKGFKDTEWSVNQKIHRNQIMFCVVHQEDIVRLRQVPFSMPLEMSHHCWYSS